MMSDFEIMDILLGNENTSPIESELANTINGSICHNDLQSDSHTRGNPSSEIEIRYFSHVDELPRHDTILDSMQTFSTQRKFATLGKNLGYSWISW